MDISELRAQLDAVGSFTDSEAEGDAGDDVGGAASGVEALGRLGLPGLEAKAPCAAVFQNALQEIALCGDDHKRSVGAFRGELHKGPAFSQFLHACKRARMAKREGEAANNDSSSLQCAWSDERLRAGDKVGAAEAGVHPPINGTPQWCFAMLGCNSVARKLFVVELTVNTAGWKS